MVLYRVVEVHGSTMTPIFESVYREYAELAKTMISQLYTEKEYAIQQEVVDGDGYESRH